MKRSPLKRRTALKSSGATSLRAVPLCKRSKRKAAGDRQLERVKRNVRLRSGGRCEVPEWLWPHDCSTMGEQFHHRKRRSQGGEHTEENVLHVCTTVHDEIHAYPNAAFSAGLLIRGSAA